MQWVLLCVSAQGVTAWDASECVTRNVRIFSRGGGGGVGGQGAAAALRQLRPVNESRERHPPQPPLEELQ